MNSKKTNPEWTEQEKKVLINLYPNENNATISCLIGRSEKAISRKANKMGLKKSAKFYQSAKSGRIQPAPKSWIGKFFTWISLPFTAKKVMI